MIEASHAGDEFAPIFVALELSRSKWLVGVGTARKWTVRRHEVEGGDLEGLLALLARIAAGEEKRAGVPVKIHICFEAGRDGHWLHRALTAAGYDVYEIDPASAAGEVGRRGRRQAGADAGALCEGRVRRLPGGRGSDRRPRRKTPSGRTANTNGSSRSGHRTSTG